MANFGYAAVCQKGHFIADDVDPNTSEERVLDQTIPVPTMRREPLPNFCKRCGAKVLAGCPHCRSGIPKYHRQTNPPAFCEHCGSAYPWATREQRIGQLYNLLDFEEGLTEPDRLRIAEALAVLSDPEEADDNDKQLKAAETFKTLAPQAWASAQPVLTGVLTAWVKQKLGLA